MMVFQILQEALQGSLPAFQEWSSAGNNPKMHKPKTTGHWSWSPELKHINITTAGEKYQADFNIRFVTGKDVHGKLD